MKKQLFFDDSRLFTSLNTERKYGTPELCGVYTDGVCSPDFPGCNVLRLPDGTYRMTYQGKGKSYSGMKLFAADSKDGISFAPARINAEGAEFENEIMTLPEGGEVGFIYDDPEASGDERYKMLFSDASECGNFIIKDEVYTSGDLVNWKLLEGAAWGNGTEPLVSCFYNKHRKCHTIMNRPFWGIRRIGYTETKDWTSISEWQGTMFADSLDDTLAEVYGLYAFEYDGMYIGLPHIYSGFNHDRNAKFSSGFMQEQLAYSYDGRYWQRSLRVPFVSNGKKEFEGRKYDFKLVWTMGMQRLSDGSIMLYSSASELEHGPAFSNPGTARLLIHRLRSDGFIYLRAMDGEVATVATREKVWHGGELSVNIRARKATAAIFVIDDPNDCLAMTKPIKGYAHEDCIPFSGDSIEWIPAFRSGKSLSELSGKTICIEIKYEDGELYSLYGDFTDSFNVQGARYRKMGILPTI